MGRNPQGDCGCLPGGVAVLSSGWPGAGLGPAIGGCAVLHLDLAGWGLGLPVGDPVALGSWWKKGCAPL